MSAAAKKRGKSSADGMTPLMRQYYDVKRQHPESLLLFRMGDFYETFDDDARVTAKVLGITLTKRANGAAKEVPLAGFPHHTLDSYLPRLVDSGIRVAICEQVEDPKTAKGIVKREVVEVVTPGTAIHDEKEGRKSNTFLGAVKYGSDRVGFAMLDHSTGEFFVGECGEENVAENLVRFSPREIIVSDSDSITASQWFQKMKPFLSQMDEWAFDEKVCREALHAHFKVKSLKGFGCDNMTAGVSAAGVILRYVEQNIQSSLRHITKLTPLRDGERMGLDDFTVRNLEVFTSLLTQGTHGTLISILDETITGGGGRLLRHRLKNPSLDRNRIERWLSGVEGFFNDETLRSDVRRILSNCSDVERLTGKLSRGRATPRDVFGLKSTLKLMPVIADLLLAAENSSLKSIAENFADLSDAVAKIDDILEDTPPMLLSHGGVIRKGVDGELDELRSISSGGKSWIAGLEQTEKEKTGIPSLKIGYNKVFGYYLEITKTHLAKVPEDYIRKQTLVNAERFVTPELKEYEEKILSADERIQRIEARIFDELMLAILTFSSSIQHNAHLLSQVDLYAALAEVALSHRWTKPELVEEPTIKLIESRHPVVESLLPVGEKFIANDLTLEASSDQILLITGPNMAGKSTYLRQIGLTVLLAQCGSFVPAQKARIGIVDRLFTRVGASDNLAGGESTFMVEMTEAANILNNATPRSLILFDEIGRGTATYDGLSLAWAITEYLHNTPEAASRTVFATHYHELTELETMLERGVNYNVAGKEFGDHIVFLRKIVPGPCDKSYGIHVALMAGLPQKVIGRASEILTGLIQHRTPEKTETTHAAESKDQLDFFSKKESEFSKTLAQLDVNQMTPLEALKKLDELKSKYGL